MGGTNEKHKTMKLSSSLSAGKLQLYFVPPIRAKKARNYKIMQRADESSK